MLTVPSHLASASLVVSAMMCRCVAAFQATTPPACEMSALAAASISSAADVVGGDPQDEDLIAATRIQCVMLCHSIPLGAIPDTQLEFMGTDNADTNNAFSVPAAPGKPGKILVGIGLLRKLHGLGQSLSDGKPGSLAARIDDVTLGFISLVVAHEVGHQLQQQLMQGADFPVPANATTKCYELEADELAGTWLAYSLGWNQDKVSSWLVAMWRLADVDFASPNTHGMPPERVNAACAGISYYTSLPSDKRVVSLRDIRKRLCSPFGFQVAGLQADSSLFMQVKTSLLSASSGFKDKGAGMCATYEKLRPAVSPLVNLDDPGMFNLHALAVGAPGSPSWKARGDAAEAVFRVLRMENRIGITGADVRTTLNAELPSDELARVSALLQSAADNLDKP